METFSIEWSVNVGARLAYYFLEDEKILINVHPHWVGMKVGFGYQVGGAGKFNYFLP